MSKLEASEDRSGHHVFFYITIDGHDVRVGKMSHNARGQAEDYITKDTARRLKLTKQEFASLVNCSIDKEKHETIWRERDP